MKIAGLLNSVQVVNRYNSQEKKMGKQQRKLATGMKVVGAGDGASEYAVSEKMRVMLRSLNAVDDNLSAGINLTTLASGALADISDILKQMKALALNAANGTNTKQDRAVIQKEISQRLQQIDAIAYETNYNGADGVHPLLGDINYAAGSGYVSKLKNYVVQPTEGIGGPYSFGKGGMNFYASGDAGTDVWLGSLGCGSGGVMFRVSDGTHMQKVYLNKAAYTDHLTKVIQADNSVVYKYDDGDIQFEVRQKISQYQEIDSLTMQGSSFFDAQYEFINTGSADLAFDMIIDFDPYNGYFDDSIPYEVNGVQHGDQYKDDLSASWEGNYEFTYPSLIYDGLSCQVVTRIAGDGIENTPDRVMLWGEGRDPMGLDEFWDDVDSNAPSTSSSKTEMVAADNVLSLWRGCTAAANGGAYTANMLHGVRYPVTMNDSGGGKIWIQSGTKSAKGFYLPLVDATVKNLGIGDLDVSTEKGAIAGIAAVDKAVDMVNGFHTHFGSYQNGMEYAMANEKAASENVAAAESAIRDANMARGMVGFVKQSILLQGSQFVLAQSKNDAAAVLQLLGI